MNTARTLILLPMLALVFLSGCSIGQKSTPSKFYVLTALPRDTEPLPQFQDNPPNLGVPQVQVPSFLDRPQITYRLDSNEVKYNEFARWAEPLGDGVTRVTRQNLTELLGAGRVAAFPWMQPYPRQYTFSVVVTDFCADPDGRAQLSVIYRVADEKNQETYLVREASFKHATDGLTNDNAVEALSDTLGQMAQAAAQDVAEIDRKMRAGEAL